MWLLLLPDFHWLITVLADRQSQFMGTLGRHLVQHGSSKCIVSKDRVWWLLSLIIHLSTAEYHWWQEMSFKLWQLQSYSSFSLTNFWHTIFLVCVAFLIFSQFISLRLPYIIVPLFLFLALNLAFVTSKGAKLVPLHVQVDMVSCSTHSQQWNITNKYHWDGSR